MLYLKEVPLELFGSESTNKNSEVKFVFPVFVIRNMEKFINVVNVEISCASNPLKFQ